MNATAKTLIFCLLRSTIKTRIQKRIEFPNASLDFLGKNVEKLRRHVVSLPVTHICGTNTYCIILQVESFL